MWMTCSRDPSSLLHQMSAGRTASTAECSCSNPVLRLSQSCLTWPWPKAASTGQTRDCSTNILVLGQPMMQGMIKHNTSTNLQFSSNFTANFGRNSERRWKIWALTNEWDHCSKFIAVGYFSAIVYPFCTIWLPPQHTPTCLLSFTMGKMWRLFTFWVVQWSPGTIRTMRTQMKSHSNQDHLAQLPASLVSTTNTDHQ